MTEDQRFLKAMSIDPKDINFPPAPSPIPQESMLHLEAVETVDGMALMPMSTFNALLQFASSLDQYASSMEGKSWSFPDRRGSRAELVQGSAGSGRGDAALARGVPGRLGGIPRTRGVDDSASLKGAYVHHDRNDQIRRPHREAPDSPSRADEKQEGRLCRLRVPRVA
jgi:hypothetical protein